MADDHSQRPYRSSESIARTGQGKASASGTDPLAELARLIGQSDPFGEFSRENARRAAVAQPGVEEPAATYAAPAAAPQAYARHDHYAAQPAKAQTYETQGYGQQAYAQPAYGQQTYAAADAGDTAYPPQPAGVEGYEHAEHYPASAPFATENQDFYDDVPPSRRRMGVMVIAGVFALAIVGTAGAFGYRALFGSSGSHSPPPVIKADTQPSKIVPATAKDAQSNKLITDRVTGPQGEKLVSREEQPVDRPALAPDNGAGNSVAGTPSAALGSGVVATEPKKVRTIAIHPDQVATADTPPAAASPLATAAAEPPTRVTTQPHRAVSPPPERQPAPHQVQTQPVRPAPQAAAPAPSNAPLSLNPNAQVARASAPARIASVAPVQAAPSAGGGGHGYAVQVTSQRSEAEAQAAFRSLQGKYPGQLGGKQPFIHRVDLGAKGTYYRAMVGPFASANEASALCSGLKAAGGQCIVQRN